MKIVQIYSVQYDNGYVLKNFGKLFDAEFFCHDNFPNEEIQHELYDVKTSLKNFY